MHVYLKKGHLNSKYSEVNVLRITAANIVSGGQPCWSAVENLDWSPTLYLIKEL